MPITETTSSFLTMYFPTVLPTIVQSIVDNNITFPFGCYCSRRGGSLDSGHGHTDHAIYRVSQKNALSELCCSTVLPILQPSFISWLDESEYLLARYEWRLEDWEEQHGSESAFFGTPCISPLLYLTNYSLIYFRLFFEGCQFFFLPLSVVSYYAL